MAILGKTLESYVGVVQNVIWHFGVAYMAWKANFDIENACGNFEIVLLLLNISEAIKI